MEHKSVSKRLSHRYPWIPLDRPLTWEAMLSTLDLEHRGYMSDAWYIAPVREKKVAILTI